VSLRKRVEQQAEAIRSMRDEIRVQLHLGKMEAQEMWEDLEKRWEHAEAKLKVVADTASEAAEDIGEATEMVLSEVKDGYIKLRDLL
jgi:hypothetical protein